MRLVRFVAADDSGEIVNPDGVRNQIEGGISQSASWTLREAVVFDETGVTSRDWSTYPILRFPDLPDKVEAPDRPTRSAVPRHPASAPSGQRPRIGNALAVATGTRMRELPFSRRHVKAAIGV